MSKGGGWRRRTEFILFPFHISFKFTVVQIAG